jgi:exosortase
VVQPDLRRIAFAAAIALGVFAYWPLLASTLMLPSWYQIELWLFRPGQLPAPLVFGLAAWLLWRRRGRLRALPAGASAGLAVALALVAGAWFVWARLTSAAHLLLPALAATLIAWAAATRGRAGARAVLAPALVLLLGLPIPMPLRNEIVWRLQLATASAARPVLAWFGRDFIREGVILSNSAHSFHVIDGCSGLQGIATLIAVAVVVRELFALAGVRAWALFALAPVLGYALNVVRIAFVAGSANPEAYAGLQGDHTPQGVALLAGGTALLYGSGQLLARRVAHAPAAAAAPTARSGGWVAVLAGLAALAVLSIALPPFPRPRIAPWQRPGFPEASEGWTSEPLHSDPFYLPAAIAEQTVYRRYQPGADPQPRVVDALIGGEGNEGIETSDLFASKLMWPEPEWTMLRRAHVPVPDLGLDADLSIAARAVGPERAVVFHWLVRDEGLVRESLRSLLALEASPFARTKPRVVVRLVAFAPSEEPVAVDLAKQRIERFIAAFHAQLSAL